jgi:hypothetical protein
MHYLTRGPLPEEVAGAGVPAVPASNRSADDRSAAAKARAAGGPFDWAAELVGRLEQDRFPATLAITVAAGALGDERDNIGEERETPRDDQ